MFRKLCLATIVVPLVSALVLQIPENPTSQGNVTISWTQGPNDPATFTLELVNEAFHDTFAIANNVNPTAGSITLTLPVVPVRDGYSLEAVEVGNITNVFSSTGTFSVGASTNTVTPSSVSSTSTVSNTPSSGSVTVSVSSSLTSPAATNTIGTQTVATSAGSQSAPPSTSSAVTSFNGQSGALSTRMGAGSIAAFLVSVAAGAVAVIF